VSRRPEKHESLNATGSEPAKPLDQRPVNRELPPDLKPLEAMLASLSPSAEGLEYDLILFRAGQRSVAGRPRRAAAERSLAMPSALVVMSTVACALLVMLLQRPIVYRTKTVHVPVADRSDLDQRNEPVSKEPPLAPDASIATPWNLTDNDNSNPLRARAASLEIFDWMLQQEVAPRTVPERVPAGETFQRERRVKDPVPYLQQLKKALDDQWHASVLGDGSNVSPNRGADS